MWLISDCRRISIETVVVIASFFSSREHTIIRSSTIHFWFFSLQNDTRMFIREYEGITNNM